MYDGHLRRDGRLDQAKAHAGAIRVDERRPRRRRLRGPRRRPRGMRQR